MDDALERIREQKLRELQSQVSRPRVSSPILVADNDFDELVRRHHLVIVDCWAAWCGPCRTVAPIIDELAAQYAGKVVFGKLNVDENPVTAGRFGIMAIPTLLVFRDGLEADRIVGLLPKDQLEDRIRSHF